LKTIGISNTFPVCIIVEVSVKEGFINDRPHQSSIITLHTQFPVITATPRTYEGPKFFASYIMKHAAQRDALQLLVVGRWIRTEVLYTEVSGCSNIYGWINRCIITYSNSFHTLRP
jgi:hypothetical protein